MNREDFDIAIVPMKDRMYRLAVTMLCDYAEAQDAVQDVFERIWLRLPSVDGGRNVESFVMTSVRNACLDRLRSRKGRRNMDDESAAEHLPARGSQPYELSDTHTIVKLLIQALPEKQRTIIHLRDVEGYEMSEIAQVSDMDEATVRMYLSRARKTVRLKLLKIMNYGTAK